MLFAKNMQKGKKGRSGFLGLFGEKGGELLVLTPFE
jgi:hypothetical protein